MKKILLILLLCNPVFGQMKPMLGSLINWAAMPKGLIGTWFELEGTGNKTYDSSGYGNTGTLVSAITWVAGESGPALQFGGSEDYVSFGDLDLFEFGTAPITVIIKFNRAAGDLSVSERFVSKGSTGTNYGLDLSFLASDDSIFFGDSGGFISTDTKNFDDGTWHVVAGVYKGGSGFDKLSIYIDGVLQAVSTTGTFDGFTANSEPFTIGCHVDDGSISGDYAGKIEYVLIFNRVLTASEVSSHYKDQFSMFGINRTSFWQSLQGNGVSIPVIFHSYKLRRAG